MESQLTSANTVNEGIKVRDGNSGTGLGAIDDKAMGELAHMRLLVSFASSYCGSTPFLVSHDAP
jgi:hypothetical protein